MFGRDEKAPLCLKVLLAYEEVIGSGRAILEMVDRWEALICLARVDLISFN